MGSDWWVGGWARERREKRGEGRGKPGMASTGKVWRKEEEEEEVVVVISELEVPRHGLGDSRHG